MNREKAREAAEIMLAYANGEEIERYDDFKSEWEEVTNCTFDWFTYDYRVKPKGKFNPKTLQPFERVLVRDGDKELWACVLFSHYTAEVYPFVCGNTSYMCCIPYNADTKYLVGTNKEAPKYYRYWEE